MGRAVNKPLLGKGLIAFHQDRRHSLSSARSDCVTSLVLRVFHVQVQGLDPVDAGVGVEFDRLVAADSDVGIQILKGWDYGGAGCGSGASTAAALR